jgi:para-nitrobenzyl esterase
MWKGIPYAQPPVGEERFCHARPPLPWSGALDASAYGPLCPQARKDARMSEDCLTLNIWSADDGAAKKPVMFYVHGGAFADGGGSDPDYEGTKLAREGVVVVTINYRLGVLGAMDFSFLGEGFQPNCGMTDIIQALRWTVENIGAFGGDAGNITVFGQSAGAIAVSVLITLPDAQPHIAKAIMMSGSPVLMHTKEQYQKTAREFMEFMGLDTAEKLKAADAQGIADAQGAFARHCGLGSGTYMIEIDGGVVPQYPIPAVTAGVGKPIPLLIGTTREEMSFLFVKPFDRFLDVDGIFSAGVGGEQEETMKRIGAAYTPYGERKKAVMMSDLVFRMPSVWFAEAYGAYAPVWMYRYDYESPTMRITRLHTFHASDLPPVFGNYGTRLAHILYPLTHYKPHFKRLAAEMRGDFARFAREGALPWPRCVDGDTPAKCYDRRIVIEPAVPQEVKGAYIGSNYHRRSLRGESNNLR